MQRVRFEHPRDFKWGHRVLYLYIGLGTLAIAVGFAAHHWYGHSLGSLLIGGAILWLLVRTYGQMSEYVEVSDEQIDAKNYLGKCVGLKWERIAELQIFEAPRRTAALKIVRLISLDRRQEIFFSDRISRFDELMTHIHAKTRHARTGGKPTWWERQFY